MLLKASAAVSAAAVIGGALWAAGEFTETRPVILREFRVTQKTVEDTSQAVLLLQFQLLMEKQKQGALTFDEQQTMCRIADVLGYRNIQGC